MRRTSTSLICWLTCALLVSGAGIDTKQWKHVNTVNTIGGSPYAEAPLGAAAWVHSESSLRDLRLLDEHGSEVPYALRDLSKRDEQAKELHSLILDRVLTARGELQFVLDFGASRTPHNTLRLRWSDRNFRRAMRIESSDNQRAWDLVKETTLLDFEQDGQVFRTEDVRYADSSRRFLRVTIDQWKDAGSLVSATSRWRQTSEGEWVDLGVAPHQALPQTSSDQAIEVRLPFAPPNRLRLRIDTADLDFVRNAEIATELPGQPRAFSCGGTLVRVKDTDSPFLECRSIAGRKLIVTIRNANNAPLNIRGVRIMAPAQHMIFKLTSGTSYKLYAGNASAAAPVYDLNEVLRRLPEFDPVHASLTDWKPNPAYVPPALPLSESAKGWLNILLGVILAGIVLTSLFLLRMARRSSSRRPTPD